MFCFKNFGQTWGNPVGVTDIYLPGAGQIMARRYDRSED